MGLRTWLRTRILGFGNRARPMASFEAARRDRLTYNFQGTTTSADAEIKGSLSVLRDRARVLARDNNHVRAVKRTYRVNIIGHRGIKVQCQVKKIGSDDLDDLRNGLIEKLYSQWCRAQYCDVSGMHTMHSFELQIAGALVETGELFFRIVRRPFGGSRVPIALEMIEADQLDEDESGMSDIPGRTWRMGIERDEWGRATRYKFLLKHPGDYELSGMKRDNRKHIILSAADVIHVYGIPERVGQTRMEPAITPGILTAWNLREYRKAHWTRKRVQAAQLGWIMTPEGQYDPGTIEEETGRRIMNTEAGQYNELDPGQTVIPPSFGPDDNQYPEVVKDQIRDLSTGVGCSYATISKDYSDANYSSLKISTSEDRDWWRILQTAVIEQFHQRVYEEFLYAAVMSGALPSPTFDDFWFRPERYNRPRWQTRAWDALDPQKEMKAKEQERTLMLKTHSEQIMEHTGEDFDEVMTRIKREKDLKESLGLMPEEPGDPQDEEQVTST